MPHLSAAEAPSPGLYRFLVEYAVDLLSLHDVDGTYRYASPAFADLLGHDPAALLGTDCYALFHPEDLAAIRASHATVVEAQATYAVQYRIRCGDGSYRWVETTGRLVDPGPGGERPAIVAVTRPLQERREVLDTLEQERHVSHQLRELDALKSRLLTAVSHEIRTPLTSISGFAKTLHNADRLTEERRRHLLERLLYNAEELERRLGQLVDADQLTRQIRELHRGPVDLGDLVRRLVYAHTPADRPAQVRVAEPVMVFADSTQIVRALTALLDNAATHAGTSQPEVVVSRIEEGALLAVEERGPGVADALKTFVFEAFAQGDVVAHDPGLGLGLYIVAEVVRQHGGRAWIEDRPGGGASVRLLLPQHGQ